MATTASKISTIRPAQQDALWSVREDLHARFDGLVDPVQVDAILDHVASNREAKITVFSKIFIAREATAALQQIAGNVNADLLDFIALNRGMAA
ncbi:hypothetical protein cgp_2564 [Corynebacterium glutamicum MB001]|uniref:Uncharacterized protein n=2 Tax=Corynebacterium TaxID=1716 RepID=A0A0F6WR29_9CORY|nr:MULTISPECIES: hypothetical protein [Corynebacterium]AGN19838.1 hypothetical protein C624_11335 [Corynebacterium glutamicum SCgG1]AGN22863.1 hypothetical protein C629_11345 [Corynebacterium glutamicum SCgG2]AGT06063.1 hypothetical protein cgp_2564 [Corynebacterium glutamicum MB001]AIK85762.1 hypothetical protein CGLAR1_11025 [Corynebacterium glutamicum]AIK88547.1 hypothetical protein AR0_11175 [Corynebacterium glutamicum]